MSWVFEGGQYRRSLSRAVVLMRPRIQPRLIYYNLQVFGEGKRQRGREELMICLEINENTPNGGRGRFEFEGSKGGSAAEALEANAKMGRRGDDGANRQKLYAPTHLTQRYLWLSWWSPRSLL